MGIGSMVVSGQFLRQYSPVATFRVANHTPMPVKRKGKKNEVHQVLLFCFQPSEVRNSS